ncbi:MAG: hypothetical protein L0H66_07680 [Loigolactobacillus coryniformis]|nr:hypothetical protein [Loigolactobacillus coryniformis]
MYILIKHIDKLKNDIAKKVYRVLLKADNGDTLFKSKKLYYRKSVDHLIARLQENDFATTKVIDHT